MQAIHLEQDHLTLHNITINFVTSDIIYYLLQVATALLVAGSTLTFWIPWQTSFASTSSCSSVVQSARLLV